MTMAPLLMTLLLESLLLESVVRVATARGMVMTEAMDVFLENVVCVYLEVKVNLLWKDVTAQLEADYCSSKTRYFQHYVAMLLMLTILYYI